jgi:hypothetical protein
LSLPDATDVEEDKLTVLSFLIGGSEVVVLSFTVLSFVFFPGGLEVVPVDECFVAGIKSRKP